MLLLRLQCRFTNSSAFRPILNSSRLLATKLAWLVTLSIDANLELRRPLPNTQWGG